MFSKQNVELEGASIVEGIPLNTRHGMRKLRIILGVMNKRTHLLQLVTPRWRKESCILLLKFDVTVSTLARHNERQCHWIRCIT
jgi:hypothetical protein